MNSLLERFKDKMGRKRKKAAHREMKRPNLKLGRYYYKAKIKGGQRAVRQIGKNYHQIRIGATATLPSGAEYEIHNNGQWTRVEEEA